MRVTAQVTPQWQCEGRKCHAQLCLTVPLSATPWPVARRAPVSTEFSRQEYWHGLPFPFLGDLPEPGIKARFPTLQADSSPTEPPGKPCKYQYFCLKQTNFLCISPCFIVSYVLLHMGKKTRVPYPRVPYPRVPHQIKKWTNVKGWS